MSESFGFLIPCKNENGNLLSVIRDFSSLNTRLILIFVLDKHSKEAEDIVSTELRDERHSKLSVSVLVRCGDGKFGAVFTGLRFLPPCEVISIYDADRSVSAFDALEISRRAKKNNSLVIGSRRKTYLRGGNGVSNYVFNIVFSLLVRVRTKARIEDALCGSKAIPADLHLHLLDLDINKSNRQDKWGDLTIIRTAVRNGILVESFEIEYNKRIWGGSKISKFRDGYAFLLYLIKYF